MFSSLKSLKENAISFSVQKAINLRADKLGVTIDSFHIDTTNKNITATLKFKDEKETLVIEAHRYSITQKNNSHFLEVENIVKSRSWENSYIDGKRYKIPKEIVKIVTFLL